MASLARALVRSRALVAIIALTLATACAGSHPAVTGPARPAAPAVSVRDDIAPYGVPPPEPITARPPARLKIPAIGVDAGVEHVPFLAVPQDPNKVAWFETGPAPGEGGDAVFDGHLDWTTGPAVFWRLREVKVGDQLVVSGSNSHELTFVVTEVDVVDASSVPPNWLYAASGPPEMSLITCEGVYSRARGYNERLLVRSALQQPN